MTPRPFWSLVDMDGPVPESAPGLGRCWLWTGTLNRHGYGTHGARGLAHRQTYEDLIGPIPDGLTLDHLCRVRHCVRPSHMEPASWPTTKP